MKVIPSSRRPRYAARATVFLIIAALIAGMVGCDGGGNGGDDNPPPSENLEIRTWYDLDDVRDNLAGNHTLMNDLDSTTAGYEELAGPTADSGKGWEPIGWELIGNELYSFTGTFDGQGYEIRDLFINRPDESEVGLFGCVGKAGHIKGVGVVNANMTSGHISDHLMLGGLVAYSEGTVSNSYSTGSVNGTDVVGGLVGWNHYGTVSNSYSTSNVTGDWSVGGLIGNNSGNVSNCYSTGIVYGQEWVGGLVGWNEAWHEATVNNSYSTSNVTGDVDVGGLVGKINGYEDRYGTVSNCYSTGKVTGNLRVGGLVGWNAEDRVSDSFWDTESSGQVTSDGGTGKTTAEMQDIATFSGAGWDIIAVALNETNPAYIWNIVNGVMYPFLSWQS